MGKNKKLILSLCLLIFSIGFLFLFPKPVFGGIDSLVASVISWFLKLICSFLGQLTAWIIGFIAKVAQYNDFGRTQVVNKGWEILRDLANMFFILGFLVIAFATVLKIEKYSYKRLLFPLLLMALLVNFSRTICLLVIDFAQVIMLSFVNAFKDIQSGNLAQLLGIEKTITLSAPGVGGQMQPQGLSGWDLTLAWLLGTVMMFIALVVSSIILVILIMRIIAIWILLVLSPLAFILYVIPGGQRYVSIWQSKFINQVIIGPILAFFLWLAFYAVQQGNITQGIPMENFDTSVIRGGGGTSIEAAKPNVFASFVVGIGLLIGALLATRELGVVGASLAGKGIGFLQKTGTAVAKKAGRMATYYPREWGKRIGYGLGDVTLGALGRLPLIGTPALKMRAKLRKKREYEEEKEREWIGYLDEKDVDRIIRRGMKFPHWLRTEAGRKSMLAASDWKVKYGQTWDFDRDPQRNRKQISNWIRWYQRQAGWSIDSQNNDRYRDQIRGQQIEKFLFRNPHLIDEEWMRINPETGEPFKEPDYQGNLIPLSELDYRVSRLPFNELIQWTHNVLDYDPERGRQILVLLAKSALAKLKTMEKTGLAAPPLQYALIVPFGIMRDRISPRFSEVYARRLEEILKTPELAAVFNTSVWGTSLIKYVEQARSAPSYQDKEKIRRTEELYEKYGENYIHSEEYKKNEEKYLDLNKFRQLKQIETSSEKLKNITTDPDTITGIRKTITSAKKAKEKGATSYEEATIGIDFEKLDFKKAGIDESFKKASAVAVMGKAKEEIINQVAEILKSQGKSQEEIDEFKEAAKMANELVLIKKGIPLRDALHALAHEKLHRRVDLLISPEVKQKIWQSLNEEEKADIRRQFKEAYGREPRDEEELIDEYLVEGLTNETRWAKKDEKGEIIGIKLHNKVKELLETTTGLKITDLTSNLTGRPIIRGIEDRFSLPQIIQAAQMGSSEGLTPELLPALTKLTEELKQVGGGLAAVGKLAETMRDLQRTIENTAQRTRMNTQRMAWNIRENTLTWRKATEALNRLEKKYR